MPHTLFYTVSRSLGDWETAEDAAKRLNLSETATKDILNQLVRMQLAYFQPETGRYKSSTY